MKAVLGVEYSLRESGDAMLLSTLDPNVADATLSYMAKTLERIVRILNGIATAAEWGKDILIVFEDEEAYYRYVSHFYPSDGAFAFSSGMHIAGGCGHFVTTKADLRAIEPIIAHEMTHSCLSHLPIPAWLNEGLAVNTEHRLVPPPRPSISPQQMHVMHRAFWGDVEIQQFWSGKSFLRPDNGTMLSYELARILVAQLSGDWPTFCAFVRDANLQDSGAAAALSHLHMDLGVAVGALLERESGVAWRLDPETWDEQPERGAF